MLDFNLLIQECDFKASRSGGAGGQNVNKVNTKVELRFSIPDSLVLSDDEKQIVLIKLASRITELQELIISSQTERSQLQNKEACISKFILLLRQAFAPQKPRKATKPTFASKQKRIDDKRRNSEKKQLRRNSGF